MTIFTMPSLGSDMEEGTLVEWLVAKGDRVSRGDIVAVVETEKGAIEIEIFDEGEIKEFLISPGVTVPVGAPMAEILRSGDEESAVSDASTKELPSRTEPTAPASQTTAWTPPAASSTRPRISPAARRLASQRGIDIATLKGSGPQATIVADDIPVTSVGPETKRGGLDLGDMRKAIAAAMARSKREIPHYYLQHTIDVTEANVWLEETNTGRSPSARLLAAVLYIKAVSNALSKYTEFNGHYVRDEFEASQGIHIGFAVSLRGGGLVAPGIHDTPNLTVDELMEKLKDMVARARRGRLRSSEFSDPTITVSSLGERGVESLFGVIYPPQVALVGFGKVLERPAVIEGEILIRSELTITLSADHRVSDGHRGALFLTEIEKQLQQPSQL